TTFAHIKEGLQHEARFEAVDPRGGRDGARVPAERSFGTRSGWARTETADGRRRLQKRTSAQGDSRRPIHGDDGVLLRLSWHVLRGLPFRGRPQLVMLRRRQSTKADGAQD